MSRKLNVLGIDDHPIVLEGYNFMFQNLGHGFNEINFVKAFDCESAYNTIEDTGGANFDLAVIDYSIPSFSNANLYSGKDIALLLRKKMPLCKIIMMTMHKETDIVFGIFNAVNPEGFINKSDCNTDELMHGFREVINGNTFHSDAIVKYSKLNQRGMVLEETDVRIIRFLSRGVKASDLCSYIPLQYNEIEQRKANIKNVLGVTGNDKDLIKEARTQGYI